MKTNLCQNCIDCENGCCTHNIFNPIPLDKLKYCPNLFFPSGKYQFKKVKDVLKIDAEYVMNCLDEPELIPDEVKSLFVEHVLCLIESELKDTQRYINSLQIVSNGLKETQDRQFKV